MYQDQQPSTNKFQAWLPLLFALFLIGGMLIGMKLQKASPTVLIDGPTNPVISPMGQGKLEELIRYIEAKYVDDVDRDVLVQDAIRTILKDLDPHSNYISAEQLKEVNEQLEGNFDGIGVEFIILEDTVVVVAPLAGGPSEAIGIQAGDKIVEIEDSTIAGVNLETASIMDMLRGERGTKVEVGILRGKEKKLRNFTIIRDKIPMHSVDIAYMLDSKTGYIKINRFSATTYEEFMKGLEDMVENKGMKDLIIDLRHNPGGYLQQATNILSQLFKEKEKLLVYTEGRAVNRSDYQSTGRAYFDIGNIAVLIDEGSASASEILAGAIQDHDRGVIIGRRSFGKGLVQEQYKLRDGSALRLTVARYYTPSGRSIQKSYEDLDQYERDALDRFNSGELSSEEKMSIVDSTEYFTSGGRVVYGGGGVMPDVFVPIDTHLLDDEYLQLRQYVPQFVFRFLDEHRAEFDYTLENFKNKFQVNDAMLQELHSYAQSQGMEELTLQNRDSEKELKLFIKARIAKHLFDDEGFYSIWNEDDDMIKKALDVLESPNSVSRIIAKQEE